MYTQTYNISSLNRNGIMQYLRCTQKCEYLIDTARLKILFSEAINISYFEYPQNVRTHAHTLICIGGCASLLKLL